MTTNRVDPFDDLPDEAQEEKVWYRNRVDGQRGFLIERDGKQFIQLDRPLQEIIQPYNDSDWVPDRDVRPLSKHHVALVAWEADKALRVALGDYSVKHKEWPTLKESDRIAFAASGPSTDDPLRLALYRAVYATLSPYMV